MKIIRILLLLSLLFLGGLLLIGAKPDDTPTDSTIATSAPVFAAPSGTHTVLVLTISDTINPVTAGYVKRGIDEANSNRADCVILILDTPGGGLDATKDIVKRILASRVPVVVFVAPQGAHAASAGSIILMAAHVAAMSPGTNVGAAHPVSVGQQMDEKMSEKVVNDLAAYVRSLAEKRNRNTEWAEASIRESASITETEALNKNVIDFVANDLGDLIGKLHGREVALDTGEKAVLVTKGAIVERFEPNWRDRALSTIANPNIAYILLMIGIYGIFFELMNPGAIYPGVIGAICLILAFFALQMLPVNYAGLILILIGIALFIAEVKVTSYGMLTIGGVVCLVFGSMMLISEPESGLRISLKVILPVAILTAGLFVFLATLAVKAHARKPSTGDEGLLGAIGTVKATISAQTDGKVFVEGELWNASANETLEPGAKVKVVSVEGLKVGVEKAT